MKTLAVILTVIYLLTAGATARPPLQRGAPPVLATDINNDTYLNANRILMFVTNHGNFGRDLNGVFGQDAGTFYPYVSNELIESGLLSNYVLYAAGPWIGGKVDGNIRLATSRYDDEYVPGPMAGGTFQPDNPSFRVYKLYRDSLANNPNDDYLNWPVDQGAPVDPDGRPLMHGDQMVWTVFNDADPNQHLNNPGQTDPLGVEMRLTAWAFDQDGDHEIPTYSNLPVTQMGEQQVKVDAIIVDATALTGHTYEVVTEVNSYGSGVWHLLDTTTGDTLLADQPNFGGSSTVVTDGFVVKVTRLTPTGQDWDYTSATPSNISPVALADDPGYYGGRWFTGGNHGGEMFFGGVFQEPNFWGLTSVVAEDIPKVEIRFRPMMSYTDLTGDSHYNIGEPYVVDNPGATQNAFMYHTFQGAAYSGFSPIPFSVWDVTDPDHPRQLNVVVRDRDGNGQWDLHNETFDPLLPNNGDQKYNYTWILNTDYDPSGTYYGDGSGGTVDFWSYDDDDGVWDAAWVMWVDDRGNGGMLAEEGVFTLTPGIDTVLTDTFLFVADPPPTLTTGPDGVSIYLEYEIYNKGGNDIADCYFSLWNDPDLGEYRDDLVGCDTLDNIFFCYNSDDDDAGFYETHPPAMGYKVLTGPVVPSPGDTADFFGSSLADHRNLGLTSFLALIIPSIPIISREAYNNMQGLDLIGNPLPNGTKYMFPGDPVTGVGDLDFNPADRRMLGTMGPFDLPVDSRQRILLRMAVGQGDNRLESITLLKEILNSPVSPPWPEYEYKAGWNLVSSPVAPLNTSPSAVFGDDLDFWQIYGWNCLSYYVPTEVNGCAEAYWLLVPKDDTVDYFGDPCQLVAGATTTDLCAGWNMIGCPFPMGVDWLITTVDSMGVTLSLSDAIARGWVSSVLYGYETGSGYVLAESPVAGRGYWFAGLEEGLSLHMFPRSGQPTPRRAREPFAAGEIAHDLMTIRLVGSADHVAIGVRSDAHAGYDPQYDHPSPPTAPVDGAMSIALVSPLHPSFGEYRRDIRGPVEENTWRLRLTGSSDYRLQVDNLEALKRLGYEVTIHDASLERSLELEEDGVVMVGSSEVSIVATRSSGGEPTLPAAYYLSPNYPNPFNPTTIIAFGLPTGGQVQLTVYNMLGQQVAAPVNRVFEAGHHEVVWTGMDAAGRPVASGVYFYQLKAGSFAATNKMILIR